MKYLFFTATVICTLPAMVLLMSSRRFIRWAALGMFLPLAAFNQTAINFFSHEKYRGSARGMEVSLVYIMALTLVLVFVVLHGRRKLLPDAGSRIYLVYFLFNLPSLINAPNMLYSFFEIWKMIMMYVVFLAVYYYMEFSDGDIDAVLYGLVTLVVLNFLSILAEHFFYGKYQVRGLFPHQNSMAMFMSVTGLILLARYLNVPDRHAVKVFFPGFLLASFAVVRSYSRGAIFCYPIGALLTLLCSMGWGLSMRKLRKLSLIFLLGAIGLGFFAPRIVKRFLTAPEASGNTRRDFAVAAFNMIRDKPFIGVGLNNWGVTINPPYTYSKHRDWDRGLNDEHADGIVETIYLLVCAECGIPCLLLLLLWFAYYWFSSIRLMRKLRGTNYYFFPAGTLGALTAVYMQSVLEWVLKQQMNLILLVTVFAILSFLNRHYGVLVETGRAVMPENEPEPSPVASGDW